MKTPLILFWSSIRGAVSMKPRWYSGLKNLNLFLRVLKENIPWIRRKKQRGRPPKHSIRKYLQLIVAKEFQRCSLRGAEQNLSKRICRTRVDHSVIAYWEKKLSALVASVILFIGLVIERILGYNFSFIDSTKFTTWHCREVEFHTLVRVGNGFLYPVNACFGSVSPKVVAKRILIPGKGKLLADRWYDDNIVFKYAIKNGYEPVIKPNKNRDRGYWRRIGRKIYNQIHNRYFYKQRSRGESIFASLTNEFGDRLNSRLKETTATRIGARILTHQIKLLMRIFSYCVLWNF